MRNFIPLPETSRISLLGISLLVVMAGCSQGDAAENEQAPAAPMHVGPENIAVAERTMLATGPLISGSLVPAREAAIRAEVGGPVLDVHAEEGQKVAAGTLLARIDDTAIRAQLLSARSAVSSARSQEHDATRELERASTLVAAGAIAERDLESARTARDAAAAQLAAAEAQLAAVDQQLGNTRVSAPFSGVVSARPVNAGDVVTPGTELFTIVAPGSMRLDASVPAAQLADVQVGSPVTFSVSGYPSRTFSGRVRRVNPTADPVTRQVKLQVEIPNSQGTLVGGLFAEGRVATASHDAVVVPVAAVDRRGITPFAYLLEDGVVQRVEVQLGLHDEATERIELLGGVAAGDTLLLGAAQGISPGTLVRVSSPGDAPVASASSGRETAMKR